MTNETALNDAIRLYKEGKAKESLEKLKGLVREVEVVNALLWIAKVSENETESVAAAELALALEPSNEVAKRAVISVRERFGNEIPKIDITQLTGMTLLEARSVVWTPKGINKPLGVLLESGEVSLRDLAWAIQNAYDERIRLASKTILLAEVFPEKMGKALGIAKFIQGTKYTAYQRRRTLGIGSLLGGVGLGFFLLFFLIWIWVKSQNVLIEYFDPYKNLINAIFVIVVFVVMPLLLLWISDNLLNQSEKYAIGEETESQAVDVFRSLLNEPWVIIHNFEFPHKKWGDVDLILVGTGGIWAIEVKGYTNQIRNIGDNWQYKGRFGWRKLSKHPGRQARRNAQRLKDYLDTEGINVKWVQPVVLWAGDEKNMIVENPETPVWKISDLPNKEEFWQKQKLNNEQVNQVIKVLKDVIDQAKKK